MKTTIDKAGRVVIPVEVRRRLGLAPGTELELLVDDQGLRLVRDVPGPKLVRAGKRLIARPTVPRRRRQPIDIARLIEEERDRWPL